MTGLHGVYGGRIDTRVKEGWVGVKGSKRMVEKGGILRRVGYKQDFHVDTTIPNNARMILDDNDKPNRNGIGGWMLAGAPLNHLFV